jgi:hypothetical protein
MKINNKWRDCITDPPEIGKKVLCERKGDLYVAIRIEQYYIPMPFADHYFSKDLCNPQKWQEISFPDHLTGYFRVRPNGPDNELIKLSECKEKFPDIYMDLAKAFIGSIGKIPKPEGMK